MTDYEYALRTVAVASGPAFEIAHAVAPGTLVALCGTVAVPEPASRWADSNPGARCAACEQAMRSLSEPAEPAGVQTPAPQSMQPPAAAPKEKPQPYPEPELVPTAGADTSDRPGPVEVVRDGIDRALSEWRRLSRRVQLGLAGVLLVVVAAIVVVASMTGGFHTDPNSPSYKNGYAYGHDLMTNSDDVASSCTQATVDAPASSDGKNFIAGCQAGYAARTP